jgi:uncharacterized protein (DUF2236 family)
MDKNTTKLNRRYNRNTLHEKETGVPSNKQNGYFEPESIIRKIHREAVVMLGGGRAILLQLAHPYVAAGVDDHSNFESEILQRLYRTILFMHNLVFQDRQTAKKALRHFHAMHKRIRGRLGHRAGNFSPDTRYSGRDPEAKLWVHATFIDTSLKTYQRFIAPLTPEERRNYYSETLLLAQLMEIPEKIVPKTLEEFYSYIERMLTGDTLAVTATAQRLAHAVLYPKVGFFPSLSAGLLRNVTAGLMTERFRRGYGLNWGWKQQFVMRNLSRTTRMLRPLAPPWIWQTPLQEGKLTHFLLWGSEKPKKVGKR